MSVYNAFRRPLRVIAEAKYICRALSTFPPSQATSFSYENSNSSLLKLDTSDVETTRAFNTIESYARRTKLKRQKITDAIADVGRSQQATDLERMSSQSRRWQMGDVYAPHDLSPREFKKWKQRSKPDRDVFDALNINPKDEYKNYAMLSEFMTSMGRIIHPRDTGLRRVNQRRIAKAIKRAIGMGWMPSVHKHPEMLRREEAKKRSYAM